MEKRYCNMDQLADAICNSDNFLTEDEANKFMHLLWRQPQIEQIIIDFFNIS